MSLPLDIAGSVWLLATEIWEWEIDPAVQPDTSDRETMDPWTTACDPSRGPEWRLVFKGFEYTSSYNWIVADSPLSRPWLHQADDDDHRGVEDTSGPVDGAHRAADDGDSD